MSNTEPSFTRGEYWILESVVTTTDSIGILTDPDLELALNKKGHGLDRDGLIRTLSKLFAEELIEAYQCDPFEWGKEKLLGRLTPAQIALALKEVATRRISKEWQPKPRRLGNTRYQLTAKGGAAWEAFAAPNWNRFIDDSATTVSFNLQDGCIEEVICADRKLLGRYVISLMRLKAGVGETSIVWDELRPWQATYWKELAVGHRVRFHYLEDRAAQPDWHNVATAEDVRAEHHLMWLRNWWYAWQ